MLNRITAKSRGITPIRVLFLALALIAFMAGNAMASFQDDLKEAIEAGDTAKVQELVKKHVAEKVKKAKERGASPEELKTEAEMALQEASQEAFTVAKSLNLDIQAIANTLIAGGLEGAAEAGVNIGDTAGGVIQQAAQQAGVQVTTPTQTTQGTEGTEGSEASEASEATQPTLATTLTTATTITTVTTSTSSETTATTATTATTSTTSTTTGSPTS